jgi:hypothetical protein
MKTTAMFSTPVTMWWILASLAAVLAIAAPSQATTLLSTGIVDATFPECFAANIGAMPVRVNAMKFIRLDGAEVPITLGNCNFPGNISPGLACQILGDATRILERCVIEVSGGATSAKNIRGSMNFFLNGAQFFIDAH